jgi:plastocyanin
MTRHLPLAALLLAAPVIAPGAARADDSYTLTLKNHVFEPDTLHIPAGRKVKVVVRNMDATAEEFDSDDLKREKVVAGGREATVSIGPLKPGTYAFSGEYHSATAKGRVIVE